jgi:hypothetical protein
MEMIRMKYEFKTIDADTSELVYRDKSFIITRDIGLMKEMQSAVFKAKKKLVFDLAKEGLTKNDLVIIKKEGNKTLEDNTNVVALEEEYINEATMNMFDELCMRFFNMGITELVQDIGLTEDESEAFGIALMTSFTGVRDENTSPREYAKTIK